MKKVKDLTAADFPGVDPQQFANWHQAELKASQQRIIVLVVMITINIALIFTGIGVFFGGLLLLLILYLIARTPNRLLKAAGLTHIDVKRARQGNIVPVAAAGLTKSCPQCARLIDADSRFCTFCGYAFSPQPAAAPGTTVSQSAQTTMTTATLQQQQYNISNRLTTLKILYYIAAAFSAFMILGSIAVMVSKDHPENRASGTMMLVFSLVALALYFLTAWSMAQRQPWARNLAIAAGICSLLAFPLGTALGIYTLIVMFSAAGKQAFVVAN